MLPNSANPSTAMMLSALYREELQAEAANHQLVRTAKAQRRAERRSARTLDTSATRHWFTGWSWRTGATRRVNSGS